MDSLYSEYRKQLVRFISLQKKVKQNYNKADIHSLRVSLKRIRSIYQFVEFISHKNFLSKKAYKAFKPIFKSAGRIREVQVNRKLLKKYNLSNQVLAYFDVFHKKHLDTEKDRLTKLLKKQKSKALKATDKQMSRILRKKDSQKLKSFKKLFVEMKIDAIQLIFKPNIDDEAIHKIRILLKQANFIAEISKRLKSDVFPKRQLKQMKKLELMIGRWHDREVLVLSLENLLEKNKKQPKILKKEMKLMLRAFNKEKQEYRKQLYTLIPNLF